MMIYQDSLSKTIDSVNEDFFFDVKTTKAERVAVAKWIASRQGLPGCYAEMFAPFDAECKKGVVLFTGEKIAPSASLRHVMGEEACRALILLKANSTAVQAALDRATASMLKRLSHFQPNRDGFWCCGTCDPAVWRHVAAGGLKGAEKWVDIGMKTLKRHRDGSGRWRRFPFYYTLLALLETDHPAAMAEIKYAAPNCEVLIQRARKVTASDKIRFRRRTILERAIEKPA